MDQETTFKNVIDTLNKLKIGYMVTGGFAVSFWGEPRATHDLDIVIEILPGKEKELSDIFDKQGFFVDVEAIKFALAKKKSFNIINPASELKIDFWIVKTDDYNKERFSRKIKKEVFGLDVFFITAEDLVLTKLKWFKDSESSKHFTDALGICKIQGDSLDIVYLKKWAEYLGLSKDLRSLLAKSK